MAEIPDPGSFLSGEPSPSARPASAICGDLSQVLPGSLQDWFRNGLGCLAGRREMIAHRYFCVHVTRVSDVVTGWHQFIRSLSCRETVACLYVVPDPQGVLRDQRDAGVCGEATRNGDVRSAVSALAEIMSVVSDRPAAELVNGGSLSLVLNLTCPVTGCRTAFFDFDAVAFVPAAEDEADPLYDPLMFAPVPMVNVNSDVFAFSMFTRDHSLKAHGCEPFELTPHERREVFRHSASTWQHMAERTIAYYAHQVNQERCPTCLSEDKRFWTANHQDPAFAEVVKRPYVHEMPAIYAERIVAVWDAYFEQGTPPSYRKITAEGDALPPETRA